MKLKKICNYCKKEFITSKKETKYCCRECADLCKRKTNDYIIYDNYAEIIIDSPKYGLFKAKIDIEDLEKCKKYNWTLKKHKNKTVYIQTSVYNRECINNKKIFTLHRLIMNFPENKVIDHINQDTFDNRKQNLRCVDILINARNKKIRNNQNVYWNKKYNKYQVSIRLNNKNISGGYFDDIEKAREKAKEMRKQYFSII